MSALFNPGREGFLDGSIDWDTDDIRVMLTLSSYTFDATDRFLSDIPASTRDNGRSAALASKTVTDGIADAADTSLVTLAATASNSLTIFKHTGSDATARLIANIDVSAFTPSAGQTINITWSDLTNKIFKL